MDFNAAINRVGTQCYKWDTESYYRDGTVIPMWVADMDLPAPDVVMDAIKKRAEHPIFGYPCDNGTFGRVLKEWIFKYHGWDIDSTAVISCPSVLTTLALFVQTVTEPGDSILIMTPVYYPFRDYVVNNCREVVENRLIKEAGTYQIDFEDLERQAAREEVKALLLCNPHNPVGRVYTREELERIAQICQKHHLMVFADEIHSDLVMPGFKHIPFASLSENISQITVTGYSMAKTFNLAGLQTSAAVIENEELRKKILDLRQALGLFNVNTFALEAFEAAYQYGHAYVEEIKQYLAANRDYVVTFLKDKLPMLTCSELQGTYLMWLDCSALDMTDQELKKFFIEEAKVGLEEGYVFGSGGQQHMRMNIACPMNQIQEAMKRIEMSVKTRMKN